MTIHHSASASYFRLMGIFLAILVTFPIHAQKARDKKPAATAESKEKKTGFDTVDLSGLKFRSIGPAITSGRISEFAVDPKNHNRYFVAVSSGGVWRTINAGNTFEPVFD